jgi:hypothetical protein
MVCLVLRRVLMPEMKDQRASFASAVVHKDRWVVAGGSTAGNILTDSHHTSNVECFNATTARWTPLARLGRARGGAAAVVLGIDSEVAEKTGSDDGGAEEKESAGNVLTKEQCVIFTGCFTKSSETLRMHR